MKLWIFKTSFWRLRFPRGHRDRGWTQKFAVCDVARRPVFSFAVPKPIGGRYIRAATSSGYPARVLQTQEIDEVFGVLQPQVNSGRDLRDCPGLLLQHSMSKYV